MKIGWSQYAINQNEKGKHSTFLGKHEELLNLVKKHWNKRIPGVGRKDLSEVVVVPIEEPKLYRWFSSPWADIKDVSHLKAKVVRRQEKEDPYVEVHGKGRKLPVKYAKVVLYSAATLEEGNERSGDFDWEIVAIMCGPWENEPMSPLTMARNYLKKTGGTFAPYTAQQFAESIYFWSGFTKVK